MRRLNVLYFPHPSEDVNLEWGEHIIQAIRDQHDLRVFDRSQPAEPQFCDIEVIVDLGGNISAEFVDVAAKAGVKYIQAQTNGLDHVEVDRILGAGMMLAHCPGQLSSVALAESAMMFILLFARQYGQGQINFKSGKMFFPRGMELVGRTLGIVGFGASGLELARRAKPFGMRIMGIDIRQIEQDILDEIQPEFMGGPDDLDRVVKESDFLSVHLHLTDETRHIIDKRRIGLMKPTACLVNVARGGLADEAALNEALADERIGGAGLDAFAEEPPEVSLPVYQLPNVYVTPHVGGSSDGTSRKRAAFAAENLQRYAQGEPLHAQVKR